MVTGSTDGLTSGEGVPLPPGEEGAAMRLQAVLAGRRCLGGVGSLGWLGWLGLVGVGGGGWLVRVGGDWFGAADGACLPLVDPGS